MVISWFNITFFNIPHLISINTSIVSENLAVTCVIGKSVAIYTSVVFAVDKERGFWCNSTLLSIGLTREVLQGLPLASIIHIECDTSESFISIWPIDHVNLHFLSWCILSSRSKLIVIIFFIGNSLLLLYRCGNVFDNLIDISLSSSSVLLDCLKRQVLVVDTIQVTRAWVTITFFVRVWSILTVSSHFILRIHNITVLVWSASGGVSVVVNIRILREVWVETVLWH